MESGNQILLNYASLVRSSLFIKLIMIYAILILHCIVTSNKDDPCTFSTLTMIASASSVCFFLVVLSLVLSFIVGFACGHCNKRFNGRAKDDLLKSSDRPFRLAMGYPNVEAVYECPDDVKHQNHEPKLEDNIAYAPLQQFQQS